MTKTKLILLILSVTGFLLRVVNIGTNPVSLYWDEASIGYEAYSVATTGRDMHGLPALQSIFPAYGDYKAPVYIWLTAISEKLFGPTPFAVRLPSALLGTFTILLIYLLALSLIGSTSVALFSAAALTFMPWHIQFSRTGFEGLTAVFFVALSLYFALKIRDHLRLLPIFGSAVFGSLAVYTYFSARIVVPLMIIFTFMMYTKRFKILLVSLLLWIGVFGLSLLPLYLSPYAKPADQIRLSADNITQNQAGILYSNSQSQSDNFSLIGRMFHHRYLYLIKELAENMGSHFQADYLFFSGDANLRHSTQFSGLLLPAMLPILILGLLALFFQPKFGWYLFGLWLLFLIPSSVPREVPHSLRSLNAVIPVSLILGLGLQTFMAWGKPHLTGVYLKSIWIFLLLINFSVYTIYLHTLYPVKSNLVWQDGYPQLARYVTGQISNYDYLVVTPGDRLFLYVLFYGQYPPKQMQIADQTQTGPSLDFSVSQIGKIAFRPIVWADDRQGPSRSLLIGNPGDFPPNVKIKAEIKDTNGRVRFLAVDLGDI